MMRWICIVFIYLQSLLFYQYAEAIHRGLRHAIDWRQQLLVNPDAMLADFCQDAHRKECADCSFALQQRQDNEWQDSCRSINLRHSGASRYWLLTMECRVAFLFYRPRVLRFQQKIFR